MRLKAVNLPFNEEDGYMQNKQDASHCTSRSEKLWETERFSRKGKRIDCLQARGGALNKVIVSRVLDAARKRYIRKLKVSCRGVVEGGDWAPRAILPGRKKDLSQRCHGGDHYFFISCPLRAGSVLAVGGNIRWLGDNTPRYNIPRGLDWGHLDSRTGTVVHTRVRTRPSDCVCLALVARQIGYSWIAVWLIVSESDFCGEWCSRAHSHSLPPSKRER